VAGVTCLIATNCSDGAWHKNVLVHGSGDQGPCKLNKTFMKLLLT